METVIKLLPDGSGRVRIHWFRRLDDGSILIQGGSVMTGRGPVYFAGTRGVIVCEPERMTINPTPEGNYQIACTHSDDPRAVTCPECMATSEYQDAMKNLEQILETAKQGLPASK